MSMFLDDAKVLQYLRNRTVDIANKDFQGEVVPFAPQSYEEYIAVKKFARAHRAGSVKGAPVLLVTVSIPARHALAHIRDLEIEYMDERPEETVAFTKPVNKTNYPSMHITLTPIDEPGAPEAFLQKGYALLGGM